MMIGSLISVESTKPNKGKSLGFVTKTFNLTFFFLICYVALFLTKKKNDKTISMLKMHDTFIGEVANKVVLIFCWCSWSQQPW